MAGRIKIDAARQIDLCDACAAEYAGAYRLRKLEFMTHKVRCSGCGKKRFGTEYQLEGARRE